MIFKRKMLFAGMGFIVLIAVLIVAVREYKQEKGPIKIGMVTTLTGGAPTSGLCSRDGVILAVEKINSLEGINGRPVGEGVCSWFLLTTSKSKWQMTPSLQRICTKPPYEVGRSWC